MVLRILPPCLSKNRRDKGGATFFVHIELHCHRSARLRARKFSNDQQRSFRVFHCALKTEPGSQRNTAHKLFGNSREIEHDQAKPSTLQDEIGSFQYLFKSMLAIFLKTSFVVVVGRLL